MRLYITLSKRRLAVLLAASIIAVLLTGQLFTLSAAAPDGSTHAIRIAYLKRLNLEVDDSSTSSKEIVIPYEFSDVYSNYNALQRKAGFDLEKHKGTAATLYTYTVSGNDSLEIHLIVANGKIIGGDIASVKLEGEMKPLK